MDIRTAANHTASALGWVRRIANGLLVLLAYTGFGVLLIALNWKLWT